MNNVLEHAFRLYCFEGQTKVFGRKRQLHVKNSESVKERRLIQRRRVRKVQHRIHSAIHYFGLRPLLPVTTAETAVFFVASFFRLVVVVVVVPDFVGEEESFGTVLKNESMRD